MGMFAAYSTKNAPASASAKSWVGRENRVLGAGAGDRTLPRQTQSRPHLAVPHSGMFAFFVSPPVWRKNAPGPTFPASMLKT